MAGALVCVKVGRSGAWGRQKADVLWAGTVEKDQGHCAPRAHSEECKEGVIRKERCSRSPCG